MKNVESDYKQKMPTYKTNKTSFYDDDDMLDNEVVPLENSSSFPIQHGTELSHLDYLHFLLD